MINTTFIEGGSPTLVLSQPDLALPLPCGVYWNTARWVDDVPAEAAVFRETMDDNVRFIETMSQVRFRPEVAVMRSISINRLSFGQRRRAPSPYYAGQPPITGLLNNANAPGGAQQQVVGAARANQGGNNAAGAAPEANQVEYNNADGADGGEGDEENAAGVAANANQSGGAVAGNGKGESDHDSESLHSEERSVDGSVHASDDGFIDSSDEASGNSYETWGSSGDDDQ